MNLKVRVMTDVTTSPNLLYAAGLLYTGEPPNPTDITAEGVLSLSTSWTYLRSYQGSSGEQTGMLPQVVIKNNSTSPATVYLDSVEVKEVPMPGD